ncbi:MAG TPA: TetR family transcriptional regulator [Planctomycetota bacterium]|nr:TetR family transcriptional regulator [Planctomycetota bacterium]
MAQGAAPPRKSAAELLGVPVAPRTARERIVLTAIDLFYAQGFNAVGLDRILDAVGLTKTTFYKHFASKDELVAVALRERDAWERQAWERAARQLAGDDPRGQLLAIFDVLDVWFNDPDFHGCLFINAASEFPNPNDPVHQAAAEHKRAARDAVRDLAARAGAREPEGFADAYTLIFEGTLVLRQVHDRDDAARLARPVVEALVAQHLGR